MNRPTKRETVSERRETEGLRGIEDREEATCRRESEGMKTP